MAKKNKKKKQKKEPNKYKQFSKVEQEEKRNVDLLKRKNG